MVIELRPSHSNTARPFTDEWKIVYQFDRKQYAETYPYWSNKITIPFLSSAKKNMWNYKIRYEIKFFFRLYFVERILFLLVAHSFSHV